MCEHTSRLVLLAVVLAGTAGAEDPPDVDQSVEPRTGGVFASLKANLPIGQEFVPSVRHHVGVRLYLDDRRGPSSDSVTVLLRHGTIGGDILARGSTLPQLDGESGFVEFLFEQAVNLEPGGRYVIEALTSGERWWWMAVGGELPGPYARGRPISAGEPRDDPWDMVFETLVR